MLGLIYSAPSSAQSQVQFTDLGFENYFPDQLIFRAQAASSEQEILEAEFAYTSENIYSPESYTVETLEISPGSDMILEYALDTTEFTNPPFMTYSYHWRVKLEDGSEVRSEEITIRYADNRYDWQVLENELVGVWWHDRPAEFGQAIFDISTASIEAQQELYGAELANQILVVINNDPEEFASWHYISYDWVGGETFSDYGITVQIVESSNPASAWLYGVIPHEISHIFFNQVTYNPTVSIPTWLNEGVAQYNEFTDNEWILEEVRMEAANGTLIPISTLDTGFGAHDTNRVYLAYYEALSAVTYLVETYGAEGLSALLATYSEGVRTEDAFRQALGVSATEFELAWAASLNAVDYSIPTPWPSPTFRSPPTMGVSSGGATPQPEVEKPGRSPLLPCMSVISLMGLALGAVWFQWDKKRF
jgi:hypothetical protein